MPPQLINQAKSRLRHMVRRSVERGLPPSWIGYRWVRHETLPQYFDRHGGSGSSAGVCDVLQPEAVVHNPLPCNVSDRDQLPDDRGWWGYSFHDVPARTSGATRLATLPECRVVWYDDPDLQNDFFPAVLTHDDRALELRELRFRPPHGRVLRHGPSPARVDQATWILERVYHNHSHWLTAHLPKLLLLRERGELDNLLLPPPERRTPALDGSLRMLGLNPAAFRTFDPERPLVVKELTLLDTDRFRPELLRMVPAAFGVLDAPPPHRKVYISRAHAQRRRLVNEDAVWALLEPAGFERVRMETLSFEQQVQLMRETAVLFAPHGAGLTNMMFCPPGADVVEIADLSFPNPNFYAVASAMGHRYWLLAGEGLGDVHPLDKDLRIDLEAVKQVLPRLAAARAEAQV